MRTQCTVPATRRQVPCCWRSLALFLLLRWTGILPSFSPFLNHLSGLFLLLDWVDLLTGCMEDIIRSTRTDEQTDGRASQSRISNNVN